MFSFWYFPGVRLSFADVSEPSVRFIFFLQPLKMDLTEGSETSAKLNLTPGKYPNKTYVVKSVYSAVGLITYLKKIYKWWKCLQRGTD
jgi:hypothetical protein